MKVTFNFPILHNSCAKCENRFKCMTMRIRKEFDISHGGSYITEILPFWFGLACFKIEPYSSVVQMKLDLLPDNKSMILEVYVN